MAEIRTRIKQRIDSAENWEKVDPVLMKGELAVAELSGFPKLKVGDGTKRFSQLDYIDADLCNEVQEVKDALKDIRSKLDDMNLTLNSDMYTVISALVEIKNGLSSFMQ